MVAVAIGVAVVDAFAIVGADRRTIADHFAIAPFRFLIGFLAAVTHEAMMPLPMGAPHGIIVLIAANFRILSHSGTPTAQSQ